MHSVFYGDEALLDYLDPENYITPLVELPKQLNPFVKERVSIFAKMLTHLPLMNVKSIPAFHMLKSSSLKGVTTLVESSSGNTALSLWVIWRAFWIKKTQAFISHEVTGGKLKLL